MKKNILKIVILSSMVVTMHAMENSNHGMWLYFPAPYSETTILKHPPLKQFALRNPKLVAAMIIACPALIAELIDKQLPSSAVVKAILTVATGVATGVTSCELFGRAHPYYQLFDWLYTKKSQW